MIKKEIAKDKSLEELLVLADELARGYFRQGLNCTECVLRAVMDIYETGLPDEILCLATGFGGGIGNSKNTCGGVSGAVMALGMLNGRRNPFCPKEEMAAKIKELHHEIYPAFGEMACEIEDHYGTLICKEMSKEFEDFDSKPRKKNCMAITAFCAQMAVKYAEKE